MVKKAKAARTMPRHLKHLKFRAEEIALARFLEEEIGLDRFDVEAEAIIAEKIRIGDHRQRFGMASNRAGKCLLNFCEIGNVVDMPECEQKKLQLDTIAPEPLATTVWRIKQDCAGRGVPEIAVRLKNSAAKCLIFHAIRRRALIRNHF